MKKIMRNLLIILIILALVSIVIVCLFRKDETVDNDNETTKVVDKIDEFGYILEERDNTIYKEEYNNLKSLLSNEETDYQKYAEIISKLYIIDLYTLSNKLNKYDVGGSEFVYDAVKENYELKVKDTIYKYIEDNSNGKRNQELPEVNSIEVVEIKKDKYLYNQNEYESYIISLSWTYKKDLDYDKEATVTVIFDNEKLYVVEQK